MALARHKPTVTVKVVDGGGPDHVPVVASSPDGESQPGAQEGHQDGAHHHRDGAGEKDGIPVPADAGGAEEGKDGVLPQQGLIGLPAHGHQVDGVETGVGDDARQDGGHPQLGLEKGGDKAGTGTTDHGGWDGQEGMAGSGAGHRYGAAQDEAAIGGHIGDIQDAIAEEKGHGHQGILEPQLQGSLDDIEHGGTLLSSQRPRHEPGGGAVIR